MDVKGISSNPVVESEARGLSKARTQEESAESRAVDSKEESFYRAPEQTGQRLNIPA